MRLATQRVKRSAVSVNDQIVGQCDHGLRILAGVRVGHTEAEVVSPHEYNAKP
ncbi:MAG: D-aminoacyl-tRNA deacylase [Anaerolineae bacterium]